MTLGSWWMMMFHVWKPKKSPVWAFFNCCETAIISPKRNMFHLVQCGTVLNCNCPVWNGLPGPYCFSGAWLNIISPSVQPTKLPMSRYVTSDPSADKGQRTALVMQNHHLWCTWEFIVFGKLSILQCFVHVLKKNEPCLLNDLPFYRQWLTYIFCTSAINDTAWDKNKIACKFDVI